MCNYPDDIGLYDHDPRSPYYEENEDGDIEDSDDER